METETVIRNAEPSDGDGVLHCLRSAFALYEREYTPAAFSDTVLSPDRFLKRLAAMTVLVACEGDRIVGTLSYEILADSDGYLRGMAVDPARLGSGLAGRLLAVAEEHLRRAGCRACRLDTTRPLKRAIAFYERNGYRPTGRVSDFFGMPLLEYRKDLLTVRHSHFENRDLR